jgi:hypothetical protein
MSFPVMQLPVMQLPIAPAHTITSGTTSLHHLKCEVDGASILLWWLSVLSLQYISNMVSF